MRSKREELAWAAGLFDGEGYVGASDSKDRKFPVLQVAITQVDRRVLDRFAGAVSLGRVYGPYPAKGRIQPQYSYHASHHEKVQAICAMLWPWLSPIKRAQFHHALSGPISRPSFCPHGTTNRFKCRECLRPYNREKMRRWRARKKETV